MDVSCLQFSQPSKLLLPPKLQDLHQFQVICRIRPLQQPQIPSDIVVSTEKPTITITSQPKNLSKEFTFHKIYKEDVAQADFTQQLSDEIFRNCEMNGKGSLVLSYGVTNSGKTFTILGTEEEPGLLPTIIQRILAAYPRENIRITAIQAYNDQFYSLKDKQKLLPSEYHGLYQFDAYQPERISSESTKQMMKQYMVNRSQTDTKSNKKSSRSHAIFKVECNQISVAIVDLAGSERLNKAGSNLQETLSINTSLLVLGKCIHAFRDRAVVPFRECKLTKALTEYFSQHYKVYMIAHVNRSLEMFHQNINVLEYAAVSTMVKHLNQQLNQSIVKSARKKLMSKSKSCIKIKPEGEQQAGQTKSCVTKKGKKPESDLQKLMEDDFQKKKRIVYERYINQMIGRMNEFDYYLDCQFEKLDQKDRAFIDEMRNTRYESPAKKTIVKVEVAKAESRIKLRQEILEEIEEKRKNNCKETATEIGPSMQKCLQASIRRQWEGRQDVQEEHNENEMPNFLPLIEENTSSNLPSTPQKLQLPQNYFQKFLNQSNKFVSITNSVGNAIGKVIDYVKNKSRRKSRKSLEKRKNNLCIKNKEVDYNIFQNLQEISKIEENTKLEERGVGSCSISEPVDSQITSGTLTFLLNELGTHSNPHPQLDDSNSLLIDSFRSSQANNQDLPHPSKKEQKDQKEQLALIRESDEYLKQKNSPFFNLNPAEPTIKSSLTKHTITETTLAESLTIENKKIFHFSKQKIEEKELHIMGRKGQTQSSWESKGSNQQLGKGTRVKGEKKPMQFRIQREPYMTQALREMYSPVQTRAQRNRSQHNTKIN